MAAIYSNGGNRWNILGFNFTKRDALSSLYKISIWSDYMWSFQRGLNFNPVKRAEIVLRLHGNLQTEQS